MQEPRLFKRYLGTIMMETELNLLSSDELSRAWDQGELSPDRKLTNFEFEMQTLNRS